MLLAYFKNYFGHQKMKTRNTWVRKLRTSDTNLIEVTRDCIF